MALDLKLFTLPYFSLAFEVIKGTVARDFSVSVFFMDLLYMGPRFRG